MSKDQESGSAAKPALKIDPVAWAERLAAGELQRLRIAVPTNDFEDVSGHAGQSRRWLVFDCAAGEGLPEARRVELVKEEVLHHFQDDRPHPLDGVDIVVAGSAGDGFFRHMQKRGANVLLTAEKTAAAAVSKVLAGEVLPDPRWDPSLLLCKVKDLFSRH